MLIYCKKLTQTDGYLGVVCSGDYADTIDDISWLKLRCDGMDLFVRQRGYDTFESPSREGIHRSVLLADMAIQNAIELEFSTPPQDVDGKFLSSSDCHSMSHDIRLDVSAFRCRQLESVNRFIHKLVEFESLVAAPHLATSRVSNEMSEYFVNARFKRGHCIPVLIGRDHSIRGVLVLSQVGDSNWDGILHVVDSGLEVANGTDIFAWRNEDVPVLLGKVRSALPTRCANP